MFSAKCVSSFGCLLLVSVVVSAGCARYIKAEPGPLKLTQAQMDALAVQILENTPEHTHFAKGTTFSWILLAPEVKANPQALQDKVLELMSHRYRVYMDAASLPEDAVDTLRQYKDGFRFSYVVTSVSYNTVKVQYADYEALLAASSHSKTYRWERQDWHIIKVGPMVCACLTVPPGDFVG